MNHFYNRLKGPDGAPVVVLLHSIATSSDLWSPQLPVWSKSFRILTIDLPGHGGSQPLPGEPTMAAFAQGIAQVLDGYGIERAAFVGISLGGMVSQAFALRYPERVSALLLAHAGARTSDALRATWEERIADFRLNGYATQVPATIARWFTSAFVQSAPLTVAWVADMIRATHPEGYVGAIRAIQALDHLDDLKNIHAPTLVIAGEHDKAVSPEAALSIAREIPGARHEILRNAAHIGNIEQATAFTELAGGFMKEALLR